MSKKKMSKKVLFLSVVLIIGVSVNFFVGVKSGFAVESSERPDLTVSDIRIIPKIEDPYGRYQIGVKIKNIGNVEANLNGILSLVYGTNYVDIRQCVMVSCRGIANIYNAVMNMNSLGKNSLAAGEEYEIIFNKQNYLLDDIELENGIEYTFKAIVDDRNQIEEVNEDNNILTKMMTIGSLSTTSSDDWKTYINNFKYSAAINDQHVDTQIEFDMVNAGDSQAGFYLSAWNNTTNYPLKTEQYSLSPGQSVHVFLMNVNNISRLNIGNNSISIRLVSLDSLVVYNEQYFTVIREQANNIASIIPAISSTQQISDINEKSKLLSSDKFNQILVELKQLRNTIKEQQNEIKYLKSMVNDLKDVSDKMKSAINDFITYGVDANTVKLGAGERAAVINSYKSAFDKLPETEAELTDTIKIANGRFPSLISDKAEKQAKEQFVKIYKRVADINDDKDNAAIKVMAYGLRQKAENRNLNSERAGIKIFKAIYGHAPKTTEDWNTMQAITYSGAAR
ncbi:MAG: hypothetical protein HYV53_01965 [Parcubacteria group bacterium]|nr:hypothetical protein [Parcubacteria group bacterium]